MEKNTVLVAIIALLAGFIGGFLLANSLNRSEMNALRTGGAAAVSTAPAANRSNEELTPEEIRTKIDEADKNPTNITFQKNLGIGLYRYGAMKQDENVIAEAARILTRATSLDPKDFDVLANLGNAYFDLGFAKKDKDGFQKARESYTRALALRPNDADVTTDMGISYFVQDQPDLAKAAAELERVSTANPKHDRSMQFLAQVYMKQNRFAEAEKLISRIKEISPSNPAIAELTTELNNAKAGTK